MTASRVARPAQAVVFTLVAILAPARAAAQNCPDPAALTRGVSGPLATVRYLADDALEGRLAGSAGERCAGDFIAAQYRRIGLQPGGAAASFFQDVPLASIANPHATGGTGRNVIAFLPGADANLRSEWIVIGAHYDHLGRGESGGSLSPEQRGTIHNGADDNASGVAVLLDVAERLVRARPARSVAFIAFSGEESGLLGSMHFAANPTIPIAQVKAMLNMDMVGRLASGQLIVSGTGTATEWERILREAAAAEKIEFGSNPGGYGPSDHTSFYMKDIPVLHFFTNTHADYHKPSDDWDKVDAPGLERLSRMIARLTESLAGSGPAITVVRGVGRPAPNANQAQGYNVYLGTVPDFRPVEKGVLLGGVTAGSPGDKAGLKAGDTIIRFDDTEIANLEAMTTFFRARRPGDAVRITVLRDGKEVVLNAVFGSR